MAITNYGYVPALYYMVQGLKTQNCADFSSEMQSRY
jgi:hypothetical protein